MPDYGCTFALSWASGQHVKVIPANQTLILAGEAARRRPASLLDGVLRGAAKATLQSVTVVAARPGDGVVVLRADYVSKSELVAAHGSPIVPQPSDPSNDLRSEARRFTVSPRNPVEQYARTQRSLDAVAAPARLDVYA
jgi:hypothetical protein